MVSSCKVYQVSVSVFIKRVEQDLDEGKRKVVHSV